MYFVTNHLNFELLKLVLMLLWEILEDQIIIIQLNQDAEQNTPYTTHFVKQ